MTSWRSEATTQRSSASPKPVSALCGFKRRIETGEAGADDPGVCGTGMHPRVAEIGIQAAFGQASDSRPDLREFAHSCSGASCNPSGPDAHDLVRTRTMRTGLQPCREDISHRPAHLAKTAGIEPGLDSRLMTTRLDSGFGSDVRLRMVDSSSIRVHKHGAGAPRDGEPPEVGLSRGGRTTKVHIGIDGNELVANNHGIDARVQRPATIPRPNLAHANWRNSWPSTVFHPSARTATFRLRP